MPAASKSRLFYWGSPVSPFVREQVDVALEQGFEVYWYFHRAFEYENVATYHLPAGASRKILRAIYEPLFISSLLREINPDLVHLFYASKGASILPLAGRHPLVISVMGSDIASGVGYKPPYRYFTRAALRAADVILSKSAYMDSLLMQIGDYSDKLIRLPWGVDTSMFDPSLDTRSLREKLDIPEQSLVFFDPRNARPLYNKQIILAAFAEYLKTSKRDDVLLIAEQLASPNYLALLRSLAEQAGIASNLRFVGSIPYGDTPEYYALADVVVSIPNADGLPQTLYEAMAAGCALIIGSLPAYKELSDLGMQASTVPIGNIEEVTRSMLHFAQDAPRKAAARANRAVALQFGLQKSQSELASLYQQLLASPRRNS